VIPTIINAPVPIIVALMLRFAPGSHSDIDGKQAAIKRH
jgi:hypothetical protein